MNLILIWALVLASITMMIVPHSYINAQSKDQTKIDNTINSLVGGKWGRICEMSLKIDNQSTIQFYNKTSGYCLTTPPVPNPMPPIPIPPQPNSTGAITKLCLIGDLKGSTVPSKMTNCDMKIGLGDLGYASDLSYFKGLKFDRCVVGNHDSPEDGSSAIYKEAIALCGDHWAQSIGQFTLLIGMNTNGDATTQVNYVKSIISQNPQMKTVILLSHKGGHVPPNSHHPAEAASLYKQLESIIPANVHLFEVVGHNHVSSAAPSKNWYQAGAGGKSFYSCGTDSIWTYCDNKKLGYLELTIDKTSGETTAKFIN